MNYSNKLLLVLTICLVNMHEICTSELKTPLKNAAYHVKNDARELSKATQKAIKRLQKRLAKTKTKHEKLLKRLIAKNVSRADREKNRDLAILKREIENITNELDSLSRN
jgi:gas vesicle protein